MTLGNTTRANEHFGPDFGNAVGVNYTTGIICILHRWQKNLWFCELIAMRVGSHLSSLGHCRESNNNLYALSSVVTPELRSNFYGSASYLT